MSHEESICHKLKTRLLLQLHFAQIMAFSLEALAMAGTDYLEFGVDVEEWEQDLGEPPPHLLVEEEDKGAEVVRRNSYPFPSSHILPIHHAKDKTDHGDEYQSDVVTVTSRPEVGLGGITEQRMAKCSTSIGLMVRATTRLLTIIIMNVQRIGLFGIEFLFSTTIN